ncbi:hypothetical protein ACN27F_17510 [Solwaraspora sp. WMMB335]|uniref:hypothetical protein n=1 Tax=Solwaraspora sp. WMMB335 TaxID=3404118 RepID=UPI003B94CD28
MSVIAPPSPVKDKNYDLITVLQKSLENAWRMGTYIEDAERNGDRELAQWFRRIQENDLKAGEQGRRMLADRLTGES